MKGVVKLFKDFNGYGFATGEDGQDYFLHVTEIRTIGFKTLEEGQEIDFNPSIGRRGPIARDIIPRQTQDKQTQQVIESDAEESTTIKNNPFTPQDPISDPRKFVGRKEAIVNAIDALYNGKNVLIYGHRGIGKSSVALQLMYVAQGEPELLERFKITLGGSLFNNITGDHRCLSDNELIDIVNGLITTLQTNLGKFSGTTKTKNTVSVDTKIFGAKHESENEPLSPSDLSVWFVTKSKELLKEFGYEAQGITFLIDEIDVLEDRVDLASFLKATIEKFRADSYFSVNFIVCGVTGTSTRLIMQHPSSERLFEHLEIPRMSIYELTSIMDAALEGTEVTIDEDSKTKVARLANEFPQPVHLIGYHAFKFNTDQNIDDLDLEKAIQFITTSVRKQHFQSKFDRIRGGVHTEIIRAMASAPHSTVNMPYLLHNLPQRNEGQITGPMENLADKLEIVEKSGRGQYRFRDPLFKVYLRLLFKMDK